MQLFGQLFTPKPAGLATVTVKGEWVAAIEPSEAPPTDSMGGAEMRILPGLLDIQVNGAFGQDFSDPAADLELVCRELPRFGVTGFLPTVITSPSDRYGPCLRNLARPDAPGRARVLGVHLEGPFLSPRHPGTHDPAALRLPDPGLIEAWLATGAVRIVTLAPELPGAASAIERLCGAGVTVAMGHSDASWADAAAAAARGASLGTHLFNAMRPLHHRDPALPGFLLAEHLPVSVIADGVHLAPETLRLVARVKAPDELILITDALAGLGMPDGPYELAGRRVRSDGTVGRLPDGTLSGSVQPLNRAVRNLAAWGLDAAAAVQAGTLNPARLLGRPELGTLRVGGRADLVLVDASWEVLTTIVGGRVAFTQDDRSASRPPAAGRA
ncbi:MAG: N-acetylglucosamine-6-phosphate deacetylase [Candidatus Limnocylindrales bacterium]